MTRVFLVLLSTFTKVYFTLLQLLCSWKVIGKSYFWESNHCYVVVNMFLLVANFLYIITPCCLYLGFHLTRCFVCLFVFCCVTCGTLVSWPGIEPRPLGIESPGVITTGPPGNSFDVLFLKACVSWTSFLSLSHPFTFTLAPSL